jgi:hypothetical protein
MDEWIDSFLMALSAHYCKPVQSPSDDEEESEIERHVHGPKAIRSYSARLHAVTSASAFHFTSLLFWNGRYLLNLTAYVPLLGYKYFTVFY